MATVKKNRKRRSFYKTGEHKSPKLKNKMEYRSGWEKTVAEYLDLDDDVVSYWYEAITIPYKTNPNNVKIRKYIPDFIIEYKNGDVKIIEVKRKSQIPQKKIQLKAEAARAYCKRHGLEYEFWTNEHIQHFTKFLKEEAKKSMPPTTKTPKKKSAIKKQTVTPNIVKNNGVKNGIVCIGLDISTSNTGYCVLDDNGGLIELGVVKLTSTKYDDHYDKLKAVEDTMITLKADLTAKGYTVGSIYVEEAHMRFSPGFSSAKTLFSLATFNGSVCWICYKLFGVKATKVNVNTVRKQLGIKTNKNSKVDKKEQIFNQAKTLNPNFPWITRTTKAGTTYPKYNYDMADAWIACRGGQLLP